MKCDFCGELLTSGRHPMTESGARDVTQCQLVWLLHRNTELESRLDSLLGEIRRYAGEHEWDAHGSHVTRGKGRWWCSECDGVIDSGHKDPCVRKYAFLIERQCSIAGCGKPVKGLVGATKCHEHVLEDFNRLGCE
jgi:hypothetical protein